MKKFKNAEELKQILSSKGIDLSTWGKGNAKSIKDLWKEIASGDSVIQFEPILRIVDAVQIVIRNNNKVLFEKEQELPDGRIRIRNILPSEKKRPAENINRAVKRGIQEEFQVPEQDIEVMESQYKKEQEVKESISYPGLKTLYRYFIVEARIYNLPTTDFWTYERRKHPGPLKKHLWGWKSFDSIN